MLPRRLALTLRWTAAALLFACVFAHALGGWPPFASTLAAKGVDEGTAGALQVGWYWGSAAFLAFAAAAVLAARARPEEERLATALLLANGAVFVLFGAGAMIARHGNPHFLAFIALGVLLMLGARARS